MKSTNGVAMLKERSAVEQARDAKAQYENMKGLYLKGQIIWNELRPYRVEAEKAEKAMRAMIKKGSYAQIEKDLRKKYA